MKRQTSQHGLVQHRAYLSSLVHKGAFKDKPSLLRTAVTVLKSPDPGPLKSFMDYLKVQDSFWFNLLRPEQRTPEPEKTEPLFWEPAKRELDALHGDIYIGDTIPSGHPVFLSQVAFGGRSHVLVPGSSGSGKSVLLDFISVQLMNLGVPVNMYDVTGQVAQRLLPLVPPDKLLYIDYPDYRENPLLGPGHVPQLQWLRSAALYLMDSLEMTSPMMDQLLQVCQEIVSGGEIASVPRVIDRLKSGRQSQSRGALLDRLLSLVITGDKVFTCERGIDRDKLFLTSFILNLKVARKRARRLILNGHYFYASHTRPALNRWELRNVWTFHESSYLLRNPSEFFLEMITQARNFGIGFCFADQAPQVEDPTVRSVLGTKLILRLEDAACLQVFRKALDLNDDQCNFILNMPDRHMVVRRHDIRYPFLAKIPELM
jgi:hypothetical protein